MKKTELILTLLVFLWGLGLCGCRSKDDTAGSEGGGLSGRLVIFHAGSLTVPFAALAKEFTQQHPNVKVLCEAAGSRSCARKISDMGKRCDVMASADVKVIENLLMPKYAQWYIEFANNELVLVYHPERLKDLTAENLPDKLLAIKKLYRSDPDMDPCGYRTLMVWQLMERYYNREGLYEQLLALSGANRMRPKETDLLALFEIGEIDCFFIYRSVAQQHDLPYLLLPDEVNLSEGKFADLYSQATVEVTGSGPGETLTVSGAPIVYGVTVPVNAQRSDLGKAFVKFVTSAAGQKIIEANGQGVLCNLVPGDSVGGMEVLKE